MAKIISLILFFVTILLSLNVRAQSICPEIYNTSVELSTDIASSNSNAFDITIGFNGTNEISKINGTNKTILWMPISTHISGYHLNSTNEWQLNNTFNVSYNGNTQSLGVKVDYNLTGNNTWQMTTLASRGLLSPTRTYRFLQLYYWNGTQWREDDHSSNISHITQIADIGNYSNIIYNFSVNIDSFYHKVIPNFIGGKSVIFIVDRNLPNSTTFLVYNTTRWYLNDSIKCGLDNTTILPSTDFRYDIVYNLTGNNRWVFVDTTRQYYNEWNGSCWNNVTQRTYHKDDIIGRALIKIIKDFPTSIGNFTFFENGGVNAQTTKGKSGFSLFSGIFDNSSSLNSSTIKVNDTIKFSLGAKSRCDFFNITFEHNITSNSLPINLTTNNSITNGILSNGVLLNDILQNFTQNFTVGRQIIGKFYKITAWIFDKSDTSYSFNISLSIQNTLPIPNNVSITPIPLLQTNNTVGHCNYTDINLDSAGGNQTYWYINQTLVNTANNSFTLLGGNITDNTNITFSCRYNDTFDWSNWVNSSSINVGDSIAPVLDNCTLKFSTLTDASGNTNTFNCSATDARSNIQTMSFDLNGTLNATKSFSFSQALSVSTSYIIFESSETLKVGAYSIMNVTATDTSSNKLVNSTNFHFTVTSAPSGGSSGGGGGGGSTIIIQNQTNVTIVENCNFNKICEGNLGEDALGCSTDCKLNTNFFTCDDPTQRCIKDAVKRLFTERSKVLNGSIIVGIIALVIVLVPINSPIGRYIKKPLFRRKSKW